MQQQPIGDSSPETTSIRVYGVPLELVHDKGLGPITESGEQYPYYAIVYCGYRTAFEEFKRPTDRLWYIQKSDVKNTGTLEDFKCKGHNVWYYDTELGVKVYEKQYIPIDLRAEATGTHAFARRVATAPEAWVGSQQLEQIRKMTREEREGFVARFIALSNQPEAATVQVREETMRQTMSDTRSDPWVRQDEQGGDPD